jgi:cell division protein FtsB
MPAAVQDAVETAPPRRKARAATPAAAPVKRRRTLQMLLIFVTLVLVINALVGERGLMETLRARQQHHDLVASIDKLKGENARLRDEARRLRTDPATIEALARQELGLIKPGEMLFIIKDAKAAK